MSVVGVRELKTHVSEIIRQVREERVHYVITYRGQPVGLLAPLEDASPACAAPLQGSPSTAWETLVQLGEEIGREWRSPLGSAELLSATRR